MEMFADIIHRCVRKTVAARFACGMHPVLYQGRPDTGHAVKQHHSHEYLAVAAVRKLRVIKSHTLKTGFPGQNGSDEDAGAQWQIIKILPEDDRAFLYIINRRILIPYVINYCFPFSIDNQYI